MTAPVQLTCNYGGLVNDVAQECFGLRPTSSDVISEGVVSADQATDILKAIAKGLQFVYSSHRWSFLRPIVPVTTYPAYSTGTITVDASGNVTGVGTVFPAYSASAGGWLRIPSVGSYAVATYGGGTSLTLTGYTAAAVTTASSYSLGFDSYPIPSGVDSLENDLSFPQGSSHARESLRRVSEVEIRVMLAHNNMPGRPAVYALTTQTFDPTVGSTRFITLYPVPDLEYLLSAIGTLRPLMIDAVNQYPLGGEVLAPCIIESCLAAAERDIEGMDATNPDAVHNRALGPLLAMAIQRDREYSTPETLGVDNGGGGHDGHRSHHRTGGILWEGGGAYTGWI
jgi:hypothetical protein